MTCSENDERHWSVRAPTARTQLEVDRILRMTWVIVPAVILGSMAYWFYSWVYRSSGVSVQVVGSGRFQVTEEASVRDSYRHDPMVLYRVVDTRTGREYLLINGPSHAVVVDLEREGLEGRKVPPKAGEEKLPEAGEVLRGPFAGGR